MSYVKSVFLFLVFLSLGATTAAVISGCGSDDQVVINGAGE
jgi:hypothetical protein